MRTWRWCSSARFFKAGCNLVRMSHMAFFTWSRSYQGDCSIYLRVCSTWQKPCSGKSKYIVEMSGNNSFTFPRSCGKRSLNYLIQKFDRPCVRNITLVFWPVLDETWLTSSLERAHRECNVPAGCPWAWLWRACMGWIAHRFVSSKCLTR